MAKLKKDTYERLEELEEVYGSEFVVQGLYNWFSGSELEEFVEFLEKESRGE